MSLDDVKMHWKSEILISFFIFVVCISSVSTLQCMDSEINNVRNCSSEEDVCFKVIAHDTKKVTKGCHNPTVCENIGNDVCTFCRTDLCNSGSTNNMNYFSILSIGMIMFLSFVTK